MVSQPNIRIPASERSCFNNLQHQMASEIRSYHYKRPDDVYQSNHNVLLKALRGLDPDSPEVKTVLKMMQYNALYWVLSESANPRFDRLSKGGRLPVGLHALRALLVEHLTDFRQRVLHGLFSQALNIISLRLHEPLGERHTEVQAFYDKHFQRFNEVQRLETDFIREYFKTHIDHQKWNEVWLKLHEFNRIADTLNREDALEICVLNQDWLKQKLSLLKPHSPLDTQFSDANIIIRIMKYNVLTELALEVNKPIYNTQASYVFNIKTVPSGIKSLRKSLITEHLLPDDPLKIDKLFDKVLIEVTEHRYASNKNRTALVDECYIEFERRMKLIRDFAKFPERYFSDAKPL